MAVMQHRRAFASLVAATVAAAAFLGAGEPSPRPSANAALAPDGIYLRAIRSMKAEPQPAYVVFREDIDARNAALKCSLNGTSITVRHGDSRAAYRVWFRVRDAVSVTQNLATLERCRGALLYPAGDDIASLGTAHASPGPSAAPAAGADATAQSATGGLALIGAVHAEASRYYRITLAAREAFEGHDVYRLLFHAYREPNTHPLTEMLVDSESFLVRRVSGEVAGHYVVASGRGAGTIVFDRFGPYWVVRDENFELAFNALFVHARTNVAVRGSDYRFADALPDVAFPTPSPSPAQRATR